MKSVILLIVRIENKIGSQAKQLRSDHGCLACGSMRNQSTKTMVDGMAESVQSFVDGATQSDDITMLALTYKG